MSRLSSIVAAAVIAGLWAPPLMAQNSSVKDLLNRAQTQSEKRAVEDLIDKLKQPGTAAAPVARPGPAAPADAAAQAPAAAATPPAATAASPPQPAATVPAAAPAATSPAAPAAATVAAPSAPPAPPAPPAAQQAPAVRDLVTAPEKAGPTPVSAPPSPPPRVAPFANSAETAKAPDTAQKLNLPTADIEVYFDFDKAEVTPQARTTLSTLGQALADARLAGQKFIIAGHTDGKGRPDYNLALSQRRAEAVRQHVIDTYGLDPANLIARGFGKQRLKNARNPLADENRRVQIINWTSQTAGDRPR